MEQSVSLLDKPVELRFSAKALSELARLDGPHTIEMELYFSCMIRKRVYVRSASDSPYTTDIDGQIQLGFRPVMTRSCSVAETGGKAPPVTDFPVMKPERYVPDWVELDYRAGNWQGTFGYRQRHEA